MENNWRWGIAEVFPAGSTGLGGRWLGDPKVYFRIAWPFSTEIQVYNTNLSSNLLLQTGNIHAGSEQIALDFLTQRVGPEY